VSDRFWEEQNRANSLSRSARTVNQKYSIRGNSVPNAGPAIWTGSRRVARPGSSPSPLPTACEPKFMDELPYTIAYVDLEEGIRMMTRIVDCKPEDLSFDMDVEVLFHERNGYFLPYFRPAGKK